MEYNGRLHVPAHVAPFRFERFAVSNSASLQPVEVRESPEDRFREFLEIRGEKLTEPRRVLVRHIFASHKHFDADELVADLHTAGSRVSRATVYRTLRLMVEARLLRELELNNRKVYEHDHGYPSHDHLHCETCGTIFEFTNEEVRRLRDQVALSNGFRATGHRFIISGQCAACARVRAPRRRLDLI